MVRPVASTLAALLALGAAGCLRARGTPAEPIVTEVKLEGARAFDADDVVEKLATQEPTGWLLKEGYRLDPDALATDRRRVEAFYRERGYYDARVEDVRLEPDGRGRARVVIRVNEGRPVRVTKVTVTGLEGAPEARERLGNRLPIRPGDVFTEGAYDAAKGAIATALGTRGWATAEVVQSAHVLPEAHTAEVKYEVRPGPRFRFGAIFIAGTSAIPRVRIRDQASIEVKSGAWFDDSRLARAQARVFDLGVFGGVRVTRGTPDLARGVIPVVVSVREAPFRTLRAGPGIAIQVSRVEAQGIVGWTHRNLLGDLQRLSLELRAGYAWIPTVLGSDREGIVAQLTTEYAQPGAITRRIDASARLELERGLQETYTYWSERLRLALPVRLAPRWSFVPSYNLDVYQLAGFPPPTEEGATGSGPVLENCSAGGVCLLSYLEQRLALDLRNDPVNTRRGIYVALSVQEGFHLGGSGYQYLRFVPEVRGFYPLGDRLVLAARARVGAIVPISEEGNPPIIARFFGGGPLSMRGYTTRQFSWSIETLGGEVVPVGGNGIADASVELRFPITGPIGGAVFVDGAAVSPPSGLPTAYRAALRAENAQLAAGFALRWGTPIGPLRIDIAARLPDDLSRRTSLDHRFPFIPGTDRRSTIAALHISLGESF